MLPQARQPASAGTPFRGCHGGKRAGRESPRSRQSGWAGDADNLMPADPELPSSDRIPYIARSASHRTGCNCPGKPMKEGRLTKKKAAPRTPAMPTALDQARDELFSHILRCGVLEAAAEHQKEWMDDTMQYISERYSLTPEQMTQVRALGDRFCQPVVKRAASAAEPEAEAVEVGQQ
jgi:hypothetical protein